MIKQEASRTALGAAYLRAAHQILDEPPLILDDPIALKILGPDSEGKIISATANYNSREFLPLRSAIVVRSRFAEDRLAASVGHGVGQYIIVGAGLDTFSLRQPAWAAALSIIEVDHPDTQQLKRELIRNAGLVTPSNVQFVGIDFERETLTDGLHRHGVSTQRAAFFSWLGVTMYLTDAAVDTTLGCMAHYTSASEAVITFLQPLPARSASTADESPSLAERTAALGEPFISYFSPEEFKLKLLNAGFTSAEFLLPEQAAKAYFAHRDGLPPPKRISIVYTKR